MGLDSMEAQLPRVLEGHEAISQLKNPGPVISHLE